MGKFSLLIVDDDEADRYLLKRQLKDAQFKGEVFESQNGAEAIEFFKSYVESKKDHPEKYPPLVVFLDINMPKINGLEFLEEFSKIKDDVGASPTVVMMFTTSLREEDRNLAFSYDFVKDYLVKGEFNSGELREKIQPYLKPQSS